MNQIKVEAELWKKLSHSNIVKFIEYSETPNNIYFFLEYCENGNFQKMLEKRSKIPEYEGKYIMK